MNENNFSAIDFNSPCELEVTKLSEKGEGIALADGFEIYIKGALDQERVLAKVGAPFVLGSKRCPGTLIKILRSNPNRATYNQELCQGGLYAYGLLTYEAGLARKKLDIETALRSAGLKIIPQIYMTASAINKPTRFKSIRYFGVNDGRIVNGFYQSRSHELIEVTKSALEPEWFSNFALELCALFTAENITVYDESLRLGALRSLLLRDCLEGGRLAVVVTAQSLDEHLIEKLRAVARAFNVNALFENVNTSCGNKILSDNMRKLGGNSHVLMNFLGFDFKVGPATFLQVNYEIAAKLYAKAIAWCSQDLSAEALDLCCGVGTMTLPLSASFAKVTGVEISKDSIEAAKDNAAMNGVNNVSFEQGDLKQILPKLVNAKVKAVIADPARQGLGADNCHALSKLPEGCRLCVIFCSLKALSRDVPELIKAGFKVEEVSGFDMFPFSSHVETIVLLQRETL